MAIVKCRNDKCDYFERAVPEGDCCPYCGEPLNTETISPQNDFQDYTPPPDIAPNLTSSPPPNIPPRGTFVELPNITLQLVHTNSGQAFTIDRYSAINKMYLGRQDGISSDRSVIDISNIPFSERVSRLHAYIAWDNNRNSFTIADNNSTNGTILNGQTLVPQQPYPLNKGDHLEFGREHKIIFRVEIC